MHTDLQGWVMFRSLTGLCERCQNTVQEGLLVSCEYGQPEFSHAVRCPHFEELPSAA